MKTKKVMMSMAIAAIAFSSCNKEESNTGGRGIDEIQNGEIRLSSGVVAQTRAFGIDQQINKDQKVFVSIDKTDGKGSLYTYNELTADGAGGLTGDTPMYFPADKGDVDIYAIVSNGTMGATLTHTVAADQKAIADYASSDLLYSAHSPIAFSKAVVPLTFYHMLSKVEVALLPGAGVPDLTGATVQILGTKLKADFTPAKDVDMTDKTTHAGMVTITAADNDATAITIGNASSTDFTTRAIYNEAVIVPQTIATGETFIEVTLASGTKLLYKLQNESIFESGMKYQYQITVNLTELTVNSTISDWEATGKTTGDANIE